MKSPKTKINSEAIIGDISKNKAKAPPTTEPYLGAIQSGIGKNKQVLVFVLLGILVLFSAMWLLVDQNKTTSYSCKKFVKQSANEINKGQLNNLEQTVANINNNVATNDPNCMYIVATYEKSKGNYDAADKAVMELTVLINDGKKVDDIFAIDNATVPKLAQEISKGKAMQAGQTGGVEGQENIDGVTR
jgi:hypothetical protein